MPRNIPAALGDDIKRGAKTLCCVLKITPVSAAAFGLCSTNKDVVYNDGSGTLTYRSKKGYTPSDTVFKNDLSVNNAEAVSLAAEYPLDGVTLDGLARGDYDGAAFIQYLLNYEAVDHGHVILSSGTIGQIRTVEDLSIVIELRGLLQTLKQTNMIQLTSITCRADFGDMRCKMPLVWQNAIVTGVGSETDREFSFLWSAEAADASTELLSDATSVQLLDSASSGAVPITSDYVIDEVLVDGSPVFDYIDLGGGIITFPIDMSASTVQWSGTFADFAETSSELLVLPIVIHWLDGENIFHECEAEDLTSSGITLMFPTVFPIQIGTRLKIRRDCNKSKAMCKAYGNLLNMRAEAELPRANALDIQSPSGKS